MLACCLYSRIELIHPIHFQVTRCPLANTHILVSPHRNKRPWPDGVCPPPRYDGKCYLCPGNARANRSVNEDYKATVVSENDDAPVLPPPGPAAPAALHPLLTAEPVQGGCDVVCFHPRHDDLSLPALSVDDIVAIVEEWTRIYHRRGAQDGIQYVQILVQNDHFFALVPWWAYWPFEIMVLPHKWHIPSLSHFTPEETVIRYDNLFPCSFAYAMGIHQRPLPPKRIDGALVQDEDDVAHFHVHFEPRGATVRKFLAGFEVMAEPQRDLTAEQAAERLRECSSVHYSHE